MSLIKILQAVKSLEARILQIISSNFGRGPPPAFVVDIVPIGADTEEHQKPPTDAKSLIDAIFGDGFLWAAVPKKRVTWERGNLRRHGYNKIRKYSEPKKNIVTCLECGHHHEAHTVCGNCYDKVKKETEVMRQAMDEKDPDAQMYNQPRSDIVFLYNDEVDDREKYDGKYIVEMKRDRPTWWSKNLLTKANR